MILCVNLKIWKLMQKLFNVGNVLIVISGYYYLTL